MSKNITEAFEKRANACADSEQRRVRDLTEAETALQGVITMLPTSALADYCRRAKMFADIAHLGRCGTADDALLEVLFPRLAAGSQ